MTTGIGASVTIDGVAIADGSPGDDPSAPAVLSGLAVTWGRDTTVDQPAPSTCTFELLDPPGGTAFPTTVRLGSRVRVRATGLVYPDPTVSTFLDPGFDTGAGGVRPSNGHPAIGGGVLRLDPLDPRSSSGVYLAPAAFVPYGTDPDAWAEIPTTAPGQTWGFGLRVLAALGAVVTVRAVLYSAPWSLTARAMTAGQVTFTGDGTWHTIASEIEVNVPGWWVGVAVFANPSGRTWAATPGTWAAATGTWADRAALVMDDVLVLAPAVGIPRTVVVFDGRVTDLAGSFDGDDVSVEVVAADFTAELDNINVGAPPWVAEPMSARFARVLTAAGMSVRTIIDASVGAIPVSWQDVDSSGAAGLLRELAMSTDAVMWPAVHAVTGPYLRVEDAGTREPLRRLVEGGDGIVRIVEVGGREMSACDVLRDPVVFVTDTAGIVTRAAVTWLQEGTGSGGVTLTQVTQTVVDAAAESAWGTRRVAVSTILRTATDADAVASRLLARLGGTDWRVRDLTLDDDDVDDVALMLALLDGTSRIGMPVRLVDLPPAAPVPAELPVYVEGGTLTFEDGRWLVRLVVSRAAGLGASAAWVDMDPTWRWVDMDPTLRWVDLIGVAGPAPTLEVITT